MDDAGRMYGFGGFDELTGQTFQIVADITAVDVHVILKILPSMSSVTMNANVSSSSISTMPHTPG